MSEQHVLALDVGGSSVKSAWIENGAHVVGKVRVDSIRSESSATEILNRLAGIISKQLQRASGINKIAVAFPGPFDYERGISLIQNQSKYDALYEIDIAQKLREIIALPTAMFLFRNDAEAAILGEALYGAGRPYSRLLGITLGTGLGSCFIADGKPVTAGDDVPPHGWLYSCPFEKQLADDVFSTRGLLARLREHGIHATTVASALQKIDTKLFAEIFASFGADLGLFLKPFVSTFQADAVVVTGGIAETWKNFAPSVRRSLPIPVLKGRLGRRAALLGAAALYFQP